MLKGVILAAGQGSRMSSITYDGFPKELLPIGNIPTIRFPIELLKMVGIDHIIIVIAPQTKHGIIDGIQSGNRLGTNICYVVQERNGNLLTGIGPAILSTKKWIENDEDFIVACGDTILCDFSSSNPFNCLKPLVDIHSSLRPIATIVVHPTLKNPSRFGVVKFKKLTKKAGFLYGEVETLIEKPSAEVAKQFKTDGSHFIISGYYALNPNIFEFIQKTKPGAKNEVQITDSIRSALECGEKVYAVVHGKKFNHKIKSYNYWDVGIPEDYKNANIILLKKDIYKLFYFKPD